MEGLPCLPSSLLPAQLTAPAPSRAHHGTPHFLICLLHSLGESLPLQGRGFSFRVQFYPECLVQVSGTYWFSEQMIHIAQKDSSSRLP